MDFFWYVFSSPPLLVDHLFCSGVNTIIQGSSSTSSLSATMRTSGFTRLAGLSGALAVALGYINHFYLFVFLLKNLSLVNSGNPVMPRGRKFARRIKKRTEYFVTGINFFQLKFFLLWPDFWINRP